MNEFYVRASVGILLNTFKDIINGGNPPPLPILDKQLIFKNSLNKKCVFLFYAQILTATFLIHRRNQQDATMHIPRPSRKVPVMLVKF